MQVNPDRDIDPLPRQPRSARLVSGRHDRTTEPMGFVDRGRLRALMDEGSQRLLTLVVAPAGYGKTTLTTSWLAHRRHERRLAVLTLDEPVATGPTDASTFWTHGLAGLRTCGVDVGDLQVNGQAGGLGPAGFDRLAAAIADVDAPVRWVVDCGSAALSGEIGHGLARLLQACTGALRLTLISREDPPLPLHRYRLAEEIAEIRAADLAFTEDELASLLRGLDLDVSRDDRRTLLRRTGGWPAALRFVTMALADQSDSTRVIEEFRGDRGNIAAYLMTEVLDHQLPRTRELLMRASIADELDPDLVRLLSGQYCDARVIEFMAHGNAFIEPVSGDPGRYRLQPLFREFLRSQLAFEEPELVPRLHHLAAEWLVRQGHRLEAVEHAVTAEEWETAAGLLVGDLDTLAAALTMRSDLARRLFSPMPVDAPGPEVKVVRAMLALLEHDRTGCEHELSKARARWRTVTPGPGPAAIAAIEVVNALGTGLGGDPDIALDAALVAERALNAVATGAGTGWGELAALVAGCEGRALFLRGDFVAARRSLVLGYSRAQAAGAVGQSRDLGGWVALTDAVAGRLRKAADVVSQVSGSDASAGRSRAGLAALAWVALDEFALEDSESLIAAAEESARSFGTGVLTPLLTLLRARLYRARGEPELSRGELRAVCGFHPGCSVSTWLDRAILLDQVDVLMALDEPAEAAELVERDWATHLDGRLVVQQVHLAAGDPATPYPAPSPAELRTATLDVQIRASLVAAQQAVREHNVRGAERMVHRALRLAAPEQLRRPFLEAPAVVQRLLARDGLRVARRWLDERPQPGRRWRSMGETAAPVRPVPQGSPALHGAEVLTAKEQEALGLLAELLTTEEIAERMFVSVNTVRSHVRSILRKLGVTRRNEAVRRAWDLGLLPRPARPASS
jgi:LuxR family maltose regulon positive regulatory protein